MKNNCTSFFSLGGRSFVARAAIVAAVFLLGLLSTSRLRAELLVGLTSTNSLFTFDTSSVGIVSPLVPITGIGSETIFDIDYRPANRVLYGLSNAGKLYSIDTLTGVASFSASLTGISLDPAATRFGIDFNPTVDRLRIVSNTGQDLRLTPGTGVTTIDGNLNGAATGAVSVAYTNNDVDPATGTTLFYIGPGTPNTLFNTANPNGGVLTTVGPLGVTSSQNVGFDISGVSGLAFASLNSPAGGGSSLYTIDLSSGAASLVGSIGTTSFVVRGLAASPASGSVPEGGLSVLLFCTSVIGLFAARRLSAPRRSVGASVV